ncbi:NBS-containing resistance-like protein [Tanacetum coccineum]
MEDEIFFNKSKYIKEVLKKFGLEDSKPTKTPMSTEIKLTKDDKANSVDSSKYRDMIGSLLYLTASRPDIVAPTPSSIIVRPDVDNNFVINSTHLNMIQKINSMVTYRPIHMTTSCSVSHIVEDLSRGGVLLILDGWLVEEYRVHRDSARCSASSLHRSLSWIVQDISHKFGVRDLAYLLLYADDIIITTPSDALRHSLIDILAQEFAMKDLRPLNYFLGIAGLHLHDLRKEHMTALKRILRYVQGTLHYGLHLYKSPSSALVSYTDADWGGCPDTRRSTSGYCVYLGDNLISWSSKRQPTLSRSSAEAEYRGVANVVSESCWLRNLLLELHCPLQKATLVYCDNVSTIFLSGNPVQHQRTKHIEMDIHFVREKVARGEVRILHVPSRYQIADIFTKGLPRVLFDDFRDNLSIRPPPALIAGVY